MRIGSNAVLLPPPAPRRRAVAGANAGSRGRSRDGEFEPRGSGGAGAPAFDDVLGTALSFSSRRALLTYLHTGAMTASTDPELAGIDLLI